MLKIKIQNQLNNKNIFFSSNKCFIKGKNYIFIHNNLGYEKKIKFENLFNNIAIIGMPLSGKTSFIHSINGIDLDEEIEKYTNEEISTLINKNIFRTLETEVLKRIIFKNKNIISLGGGIILKEENMFLLKEYTIIFFDIELNTLLKRYRKNIRPLIREKYDIVKLYKERYSKYIFYSDLIIKENQLKEFKNVFLKNSFLF